MFSALLSPLQGFSCTLSPETRTDPQNREGYLPPFYRWGN